jgi:uncharacterized membrane protein YesL
MHDRTRLVTAAIGAGFVVLVCVEHPALIPALTVGLAAWMALYALLKL